MSKNLLFITFFIISCSFQKNDSLVGKYNFGYSVIHPARVGLLQVFDDGEKTFLQVSGKCKKIEVESFAGSMNPILTKDYGKWTEYKGVHERLVVSCGEESTVITRLGGTNSFIK